MKTLGASAIFALAWWPRSLLAQPAPAPIYVTTHLAPECYGTSDFAQRLLGRTHRLRWAYPGEPGIVFDVSAQRAPGGFLGQLQIQELGGRFTQRAVQGNTCAGVINALAFVAAVLVDPEAAEHGEPARQEQPAPATPLPPVFEAPKVFDWGIGVTSGFSTAAPNSFQLDFGGRVTAAWNSPGFSPWITVGFDERLSTSTTTTLDATQSQSVKTTFSGWAANLALSPIRWPSQGYYFLRPTASLEIGQLIANGAVASGNNVTAGSARRTWLAPGLGVSAEAKIVRRLALVADLALLVPALHRQFVYKTGLSPADEVTAFTVPYVGVSAHLGLVVKFE